MIMQYFNIAYFINMMFPLSTAAGTRGSSLVNRKQLSGKQSNARHSFYGSGALFTNRQ